MARMLQGLQWLLFALYAVAGAVALLIATPAGLRLLGQPEGMLTFLPAKILGLPWSLPGPSVCREPAFEAPGWARIENLGRERGPRKSPRLATGAPDSPRLLFAGNS